MSAPTQKLQLGFGINDRLVDPCLSLLDLDFADEDPSDLSGAVEMRATTGLTGRVLFFIAETHDLYPVIAHEFLQRNVRSDELVHGHLECGNDIFALGRRDDSDILVIRALWEVVALAQRKLTIADLHHGDI